MTAIHTPRELADLDQHAHQLLEAFNRLTRLAHTYDPHTADALCETQSLVEELLNNIPMLITYHGQPATNNSRSLTLASMYLVRVQAEVLAATIQQIGKALDDQARNILRPDLTHVTILATQIRLGTHYARPTLARSSHTDGPAATKRKKGEKKRSAWSMRTVMPLSRALAQCAVRLLPLSDQALYRDIFTSELHELAQGRRSRRVQIAYVVRILLRSPWLRRELRAPASPHRQRSR